MVIYGDKSGKNLKLVSCIKAQKYLHMKFYAFFARIVDHKSKVKEIKDVPHVYEYSDVFPEDLPGIPPI